MLRKFPFRREGQTLLEVIVALAIVSIALVSFVTLVVTSMDMEDHARKVTEATIVADQKLRDIEKVGYPPVGQSEGLVNDQDPLGYSYRMTVSETGITNVRQIDVEIFWEKRKRSIILSAYMLKPGS